LSCLKSQSLIPSPPPQDSKVITFPSAMAYVPPKFGKGQIDAAGRRLATGSLQEDILENPVSDLVIINNWRSCHSFPLNSFHVTLRGRAIKLDRRAVTAQRIKRLSSIAAKLARFPRMELSQMQDIGGCRAVVNSAAVVRRLVDVYKKSAGKNLNRAEFVREYDYIASPKKDGYRGVHLVYKYRSPAKRHRVYNGLRIEIQLRSQLQHTWATAVETVGTFIGQALKSSQGEEKWLRFFALMSTYIAIKERSPLVEDTPSDAVELRRQLSEYAEQLDAIRHLELYAAAVDAPERIGATRGQHYFLLELDPSQRKIRITSYKPDELGRASGDYLRIEREILGGSTWRDAVLVSVKSFAALKRAYPNYFLDTHRFIQLVTEALGPKPSPDPTSS